jgi:SAM-dependent methyltransferase
MSVRDPHRFVNELDASTVGRLVDRLENRGRDVVFSRLLERYLARLGLGNERVLEVGCGTGVVTRAIAEFKGFAGEVIGIDHSPVFIETARGLAAGAGLTELTYRTGDAHALPFEDRSFDVAIAHTVISHVTDPDRMLAEMARVLRPGGTAVVFDGDYASLTYGHDDPAEGRKMDWALATTTFNNPLVLRTLPAALDRAGLELRETLAEVVVEVGKASYFRSFADTYGPMVASSGLVPRPEVEAWLEAQYGAMDEGRFFASCNYYTMLATAR